MDNTYLVPANTKKANLILGFMRWIDLFIIGIGIAGTVIFLLIIGSSDNTWLILLACLPAILAGLLILPIPNYHNTLVALQSIFRYYNERRNYIWRGWCIYNEFKDDK